MFDFPIVPPELTSLSARRAWIEILAIRSCGSLPAVALRKESVDRNRGGDTHANRYYVALRKESVDRNSAGACHRAAAHASLSARRAWIEMQVPVFGGRGHGSLSARRAWIEIPKRIKFCAICYVALRKESVDRNRQALAHCNDQVVALRKESVDRNTSFPKVGSMIRGRSPQGERG